MKKPSLDPTLWRELSSRTVMFHQAIADRMGLGPTDHKALDLVARHSTTERVTPGMLAELTGLTTGAVTGVLDRLEAAGFVRREKDADDRRQVLVRVSTARLAEYAHLFEPMQAGVEAICAEFTQKELDRIAEFTGKCIELTKRETERLRGEANARARSEAESDLAEPRGRVSAATFEARRGARGLTLGACDEPHLYVARFEGLAPTLTFADGVVGFTQPRAGALDWLRGKRTWTRVDLSRHVRWALRVKGGAGELDGDLRDLDVSAVEVTGGASRIALQLGRPNGAVPIRVRGGASALRIARPRGVAAKLTVHGGLGGLTIDGMKLGSVGGMARWDSPEAESATDRFEIDLVGGASDVTIESV